MRLIASCEARSDFVLASTLIDRVLRAHATWISDVLDVAPAGIRTSLADGRGRDFFDLHQVRSYALQHLPRIPQGNFNGQPGAPGALMARTAFSIVRALNRSPNVRGSRLPPSRRGSLRVALSARILLPMFIFYGISSGSNA